jgi:hypothetical protein
MVMEQVGIATAREYRIAWSGAKERSAPSGREEITRLHPKGTFESFAAIGQVAVPGSPRELLATAYAATQLGRRRPSYR